MATHVWKCGRILSCTVPVICVLTAGALLSTPAQAQTVCNSTLTIGFPNGDNLNRVVGQTVRMSLTVTNGPSQDGGVPDSQEFTVFDFFPSCTSVSGGVCTPDPGSTAGPPPAIQYAANLSTANCPTLPVADATNPFDIKFTFTPVVEFVDGQGCTFSFDVLVTETGSDGTPANIAQLARTDGVCKSTLTSEAQGTAAITLTCPPCDDGNACNGVETCNTETAQCVPGTPLDCDDKNECTADSCDPASGCVNTPQPPSFCDDNNACTTDTCVPETGCVHTPQPPSFCDDNNACTDDTCDPVKGCVNTPKPPDFCDDDNICTTDTCDPVKGCVNTPQPPDFCDDDDACTDDKCDPVKGCVNTPKPPDFCDDDNACTDDKCDPATGCVNTPKPPDFCDDNSICTDDVCDPATGCVHTPASPMPPECAGSCRMTGGHNFDVVDATVDENGKVYTTGGQIGAPNESGCCDLPPKGKCVAGTCTGGLNGGQACTTNGDCPNDPGRNSHCPWGDWEHNHHSGSDDSGSVTGGSFAFHSGTAAAPDEAFIKSVLCADPGWCVQARPAPFKQIFWEGTGVFHNTKTGAKNDPLPIFGACGAQQPVPFNRRTGGTLHYYKAHVGDFGEPAGTHQKPPDACVFDATCTDPEPNEVVEISREDNVCPSTLGDVCLVDSEPSERETELHPLCQAQNCSECPDVYEIEIHCTADPASPVAYRVSHFIREGNFQLHPPVGDSCNPSCGDGECEGGATGTAETCETCEDDCGACD